MTKTIYIIPGFGETCNETRYKKLAKTLESKGYIVKRIKPDWYKSLSANVFKPVKNSVMIGFSYGAVIAYLIAKKYDIKKAVFCSLSPLDKISYKGIYDEYLKRMNPKSAAFNAKDVKIIKISLKSLKVPYITLAGEKERLVKGKIRVPKTGHFMTTNYIKYISKLL